MFIMRDIMQIQSYHPVGNGLEEILEEDEENHVFYEAGVESGGDSGLVEQVSEMRVRRRRSRIPGSVVTEEIPQGRASLHESIDEEEGCGKEGDNQYKSKKATSTYKKFEEPLPPSPLALGNYSSNNSVDFTGFFTEPIQDELQIFCLLDSLDEEDMSLMETEGGGRLWPRFESSSSSGSDSDATITNDTDDNNGEAGRGELCQLDPPRPTCLHNQDERVEDRVEAEEEAGDGWNSGESDESGTFSGDKGEEWDLCPEFPSGRPPGYVFSGISARNDHLSVMEEMDEREDEEDADMMMRSGLDQIEKARVEEKVVLHQLASQDPACAEPVEEDGGEEEEEEEAGNKVENRQRLDDDSSSLGKTRNEWDDGIDEKLYGGVDPPAPARTGETGISTGRKQDGDGHIIRPTPLLPHSISTNPTEHNSSQSSSNSPQIQDNHHQQEALHQETQYHSPNQHQLPESSSSPNQSPLLLLPSLELEEDEDDEEIPKQNPLQASKSSGFKSKSPGSSLYSQFHCPRDGKKPAKFRNEKFNNVILQFTKLTSPGIVREEVNNNNNYFPTNTTPPCGEPKCNSVSSLQNPSPSPPSSQPSSLKGPTKKKRVKVLIKSKSKSYPKLSPRKFKSLKHSPGVNKRERDRTGGGESLTCSSDSPVIKNNYSNNKCEYKSNGRRVPAQVITTTEICSPPETIFSGSIIQKKFKFPPYPSSPTTFSSRRNQPAHPTLHEPLSPFQETIKPPLQNQTKEDYHPSDKKSAKEPPQNEPSQSHPPDNCDTSSTVHEQNQRHQNQEKTRLSSEETAQIKEEQHAHPNSHNEDTNPPDNQTDSEEMHHRLSTSEQMRLRSVLRKPGHSKKQRGRNVTFNESLNVFYEAECSCWVHEEEYARLRAEEHERREREEQQYYQYQYQQQQQQQQQHSQHLHAYEPPPVEFDDPPTLSPPEGYKDRFFPQEIPIDPDVTRVSPPSPPAARRKVFLKENPVINGQDDEEDGDELNKPTTKASKTSRLGGILKGGRLWRSNSAEGKKVSASPEEPDVVKCTESRYIRIIDERDNDVSSEHEHDDYENTMIQAPDTPPLKVSTGTAPLRTSEQIRLAVDSTLRQRSKNKKPECSSLVEKLRWLTSLDDDDSSDSNASGFATWPSRDKNGTLSKSTTSATMKADAGTSTSDEFVQSSNAHRQAPIHSANEAKIKQISYTLEDIDEGLKSGETELESFINEDGERIERIRKRYGEDVGGDDYGFSRRPSVKGIKPKFSSTNQIFAQFTMRKSETPIPMMESQYENSPALMDGNTLVMTNNIVMNANSMAPSVPSSGSSANMMGINHAGSMALLNYEFANAPGRQSEESRAHFEMIRQSFEPGGGNYATVGAPGNFNRPHSWSVSTLPHPHTQHPHQSLPPTHGHSTLTMNNNNSSISSSQLNNLSSSNIPGAVPTPPPPPSGGQTLNAVDSSPAMLPPSPNPNGMGPSMHMQQSNSMLQGQLVSHYVTSGPMPNMVNNVGHNIYGTLPHNTSGTLYGTLPHPGSHQQQQNLYGTLQNNLNGPGMSQNALQQQQMYGTVRRVPNVIGRPLFLHYGALSVEAHPNKIVYPPGTINQVPETPSPTQQPPPMRYYGPPIRYYNPPPPVPPRTAASAPSNSVAAAAAAAAAAAGVAAPNNMASISAKINNSTSLINVADHERGVPEGATDEEPTAKEPYSMNV